MDYARMRGIAEELMAYAERLEGAWTVEIGPAGPLLAMTSRSRRHEGAVRRIRNQLDEQLPATHPGYICANGPEIEHPSIGHYMIVDPRTGTIEVHSAPCKRRYLDKRAYIFGDSAPFGAWKVETGAFRRYGKAGDSVS
ncbi:Uma2 family endonuclease [Streptomyces sp. DSM 40484]|uniref:Uma2 family endonuclease n=1 Tax=Streptomyces kroppenstedtii TaxID=3051181 RepID=UPI0028D42F14|nr:Uma2 family endonuclease [Streptomyces sp. DSM 40484]